VTYEWLEWLGWLGSTTEDYISGHYYPVSTMMKMMKMMEMILFQNPKTEKQVRESEGYSEGCCAEGCCAEGCCAEGCCAEE